MATSTTDMTLCGGHPALDFANTVDSRRGLWGPDFLRCSGDLIVLAKRVGLIDEPQAGDLDILEKAHPRLADAALIGAVRLREAVYEVFLSEDTQQPYPAAALDIIHEVARSARARQLFSRTDVGFRWVQPVTEFSDLVGRFASEATDLIMSRPNRRPVRECKGDNCGWLFLDTSKSGRRHWCSDATCGTHARVKRFRSKQS